jgi:CBS domain-containing protein
LIYINTSTIPLARIPSTTAGHKADMQKLTLHSVLSPSVFTVTSSTTLPDVLASMESLRISCVIAVDEQHRATGIFTEQDAIGLMAARKDVANLRMSDVMSAPPSPHPQIWTSAMPTNSCQAKVIVISSSSITTTD